MEIIVLKCYLFLWLIRTIYILAGEVTLLKDYEPVSPSSVEVVLTKLEILISILVDMSRVIVCG